MGLGVMALGNLGCLITERPDFPAPEASKPFLTNISPPLSEIIEIPRKPGGLPSDYVEDVVDIRFQVHSEDLQKPLYAAIFIGFPRRTVFPSLCPQLRNELGTGTFAEPRQVNCDFTIPSTVSKGCSSITALVSHNVDILVGIVDDPKGDLATATWWAQIGFDRSARDFAPCEPDLPPPDAGRDARADGGGL
jgi:hypothetical protein